MSNAVVTALTVLMTSLYGDLLENPHWWQKQKKNFTISFNIVSRDIAHPMVHKLRFSCLNFLFTVCFNSFGTLYDGITPEVIEII